MYINKINKITYTDLVESCTNVILVFGLPNAGKTCFMLAMYYFLRTTYVVEVNDDNKDGTKYLNDALLKFDKGDLPPRNRSGSIIEIDVAIESGNREFVFTFIDLSGEDLLLFDHVLAAEKGDVDPRISALFENPQIRLSIMLFGSTEKDTYLKTDLLNQSLFGRILSKYPKFGLERFCFIVTKWDIAINEDSGDDDKDFGEFVQRRYPQTRLRLMQVSHASIFRFSIGKVIRVAVDQNVEDLGKAEASYRVEDINMSYCGPVVAWLLSVATPRSLLTGVNDRSEHRISHFSVPLKRTLSMIHGIFRSLTGHSGL